jgi:hypothetical protein
MTTLIVNALMLLAFAYGGQETCTVNHQEWPGRSGEMIVYCKEGTVFDLDTGLDNRRVPNSIARVRRAYDRRERGITLIFDTGDMFAAWEL